MFVKNSRYENKIETGINKCPTALKPNSLEEDIYIQLKTIAESHPDVSSYAYIKAIHDYFLPREQDAAAREIMINILRRDVQWNMDGTAEGFVNDDTRAVDFTIYYCLSLYCKRKEKTTNVALSLDSLINKYDVLFQDIPLSLEIRSWHARRMERLDDAYAYDRNLIERLPIEVNAGVYNSFASSICSRLEKETKSKRSGNSVFFWPNKADRIRDWKLALFYMPQVISMWKKVWGKEDGYGKHYFILGKLLLFSPDWKDLSIEEREKRLFDAKDSFRMAKACENSDEADYNNRCSKYEQYLELCDEYELEWMSHPSPVTESCPYVSALTEKNNRTDFSKPNEDYYILDAENRIYLIADGVTRPHDEYISGDRSISADCARILCQCIHNHLKCAAQADPSRLMINAMLAGNKEIRELQYNSVSKFVPCVAFVGAIIRDNRLFFSNCCDTVGFLIRDNIKIKFTEHYNRLAEILDYSKEKIYDELHNNITNEAGFGIFNGGDELKSFINVSHIELKSGDRIILASDGLSQYLHSVCTSHLASITIEQLFAESKAYDRIPFQEYADDKTCIIIDI